MNMSSAVYTNCDIQQSQMSQYTQYTQDRFDIRMYQLLKGVATCQQIRTMTTVFFPYRTGLVPTDQTQFEKIKLLTTPI